MFTTLLLTTTEFVWSSMDSSVGFVGAASRSSGIFTPWGVFQIIQRDSNKDLYSPLEEDPIQLITCETTDECWCNAAGCLGEQKSLAMQGLPIANGFKITIAAPELLSETIFCPFSVMTAEVTDVYCADDPSTSFLGDLTIDDASAGPRLSNLDIGAASAPCTDSDSNFEVYEISCTASPEDYAAILALIDEQDREARSLNFDKRPASLNNMLIQVGTTPSGIWVDGSEYQLELVQVSPT